ncbi:MAG: PqqD family peptide modification chaperone [Clostridium argentinense]|uniref:PqqD family peptide modification chaperone n=1 Tax=Clostridium faecium TaxID=2762223 RepID=A0ABR8YT33_9CLOT|nr:MULTISPECIES: PqqD family peptide modification chaperone [Clostridium]MBD8047410.1 PqqD family peptide modification chaperone [Clostridium faecium]MBS5825139.1 PqqD family peptide modification chaperone [Clostridium argentinense]MDU1349798.1 PqqD family peptide modification chaperone [Clostridium argentinense]
MNLCVNKSIIWYQNDDEIIITGIDDEKLFKLNPISSEIFTLIITDNNYGTIIDKLCLKYGKNNKNIIVNDVNEFIDDMKLLKVFKE